MPTFIGPRQRHEWNEKPEKPWTCNVCGFYTANLRHINNGFCRHEWGLKMALSRDWRCCIRCGVVMNNRNAEGPCIGAVKFDLRRAPTEEGGVVYTDDKPLGLMSNKADYDPADLSMLDIPARMKSNHEESFARLLSLPIGKALLFPTGIFTSQTHAQNAFRHKAEKVNRRVRTRIAKEGIYVWLINNA